MYLCDTEGAKERKDDVSFLFSETYSRVSFNFADNTPITTKAFQLNVSL